MSENAKISIDLKAGAIQIDSPVSHLDSIFDRLETLVSNLADYYNYQNESDLDDNDSEDDDAVDTNGSSSNGQDKPKRGKRGSGKKETYNTIDLGLNEEQRQKFREFFQEKNPSSQNDQVLVIMHWLKNNANRGNISTDEIFTGFRTANVKVPGKLSSVLGNLVGRGMVSNVGAKQYSLTHVGEDHVTYNLPKKKEESKE